MFHFVTCWFFTVRLLVTLLFSVIVSMVIGLFKCAAVMCTFSLGVGTITVKDLSFPCKGFVLVPQKAGVPHATITEERRAASLAKLDWTGTAGAWSAVKDKTMFRFALLATAAEAATLAIT